MKIQEFDPKSVVVNKAITARRGDPNPEDVEKMALNFGERIDSGLEHQIQPGVVRIVQGVPEVIVGRHRLEACKLYNENKGPKDEPLMFMAIAVKATDEAGLITAITENEYRTATNVIDRAEAMQKLVDLGKTQKQVAQIFGMSEATVSIAMKVVNLEKKYQKAILDGDLEEHAAVLIAGLATDDSKRTEIFEECLRHQKRFDEISQRLETKQARDKAAAGVEAAKAVADAAEEAAKAADKALKDAEKAVKEAAKALPKTADVKDIEAARKVQDTAIEERAKAEAEVKRLEKEKVAAVKLLDKAKLAKEKVVEETKAAKTKVSPETVKKIAKEKGLNAGTTAGSVTKKAFVVALEAMCEDKTLQDSVGELVGKIEGYLDGEVTDAQLKNAFKRYCDKEYVNPAKKADAKKPKAA